MQSDIYSETENEDFEDELLSRAAYLHYLYDDERNLFSDEIYNNMEPKFHPGQLHKIINKADDDTSSFNDDIIPNSELDFFTSEYEESDVGDYIPPLTNTKKMFILRLSLYQIDENDTQENIENKIYQRKKIIQDFCNLIRQKRAIKAYLRLLKVKRMKLSDPNDESFLLEKLELVDKKLQRPFYYEENEPRTYKRLLFKRKEAIHRKYEQYASDSKFRKEFVNKIREKVQDALIVENEEQSNQDLYTTADSNVPSSVDESMFKSFSEIHQEEEIEQPTEVVSRSSSFYDDGVPNSELEFFSSEFEEEIAVEYPMADSKTLRKLDNYLIKCHSTIIDTPEESLEKKLHQAEIEAQFRNFIERKRAFKALTRMKIVSAMKLSNSLKEAEELLHLEIVDKKLQQPFYYDDEEPYAYKVLLNKRRRAIIRKYEKYANDQKFRTELKDRVYMNVLRTRSSPLFDQDACIGDDISSFNDSAIPTSEEEFMSDASVNIPSTYQKPITRTRAALYDELEKYEADTLNDTESMIFEKRKNRFKMLMNFKKKLSEKRKLKAIARFETIRRMGTKDIVLMAKRLRELEVNDKKLNRGFYYREIEPSGFKALLNKRIRAINRKYQQYIENKQFRDDMEFRVMHAIRKKDSEIEPGEYDKLNWHTFDGHITQDASMFFNVSVPGVDRPVERRREWATAGIWPKYRESAPPAVNISMDKDRNLSLGYDGLTFRDYQKDVLLNNRVG